MKKHERPSFEQLADWLEGRLAPPEAQAVAEQVAAAGEDVQADVAWLRAFHQSSQEFVLSPVPAGLRQRLADLLSTYAQDHRPPTFWQRLKAGLSFDSQAQWATAGARAVTTPESQRQLIYATDLADVALTIQWRAQKGHFELFGHFLPVEGRPAEAIAVQLLTAEQEIGLTITDEVGEFSLSGLPGGTYDLILSGDGFEISIDALVLAL